MPLAGNERFRVFTEEEFFAGADFDPAPAPRNRGGRERRSRRTAGAMALAGTLGTVAAAIALAYVPRASRPRAADSAHTYPHRSARVRTRAVRDARARVRPRDAVPAVTRHEPRHAQLRAVTVAFRRRARRALLNQTRAAHEHDVARVAREQTSTLVVARDVVSTAVARPANTKQVAPSEFSFER